MDIMIDLETMGVGHGAPIISIGAVAFDRTKKKIESKFYACIDFEDALENGDADPLTIKWWLRQSKSAREELISGDVTLLSALSGLHVFYEENYGQTAWGNGATFDITILESAYRRVKMKAPWSFWSVRDVRTVVDLAQGIVERPPMSAGTAHNALDDAIHQAKYVMDMIEALRG